MNKRINTFYNQACNYQLSYEEYAKGIGILRIFIDYYQYAKRKIGETYE